MALGLWGTGHHRPRLGCGVADARSRGTADGCNSGGIDANPGKDRLPASIVQPDDRCELVRELRRPMGVVTSPILARGVSDQRAWLYTGFDRPVGRAPSGYQRDCGYRRRMVFATPARPRCA